MRMLEHGVNPAWLIWDEWYLFLGQTENLIRSIHFGQAQYTLHNTAMMAQ
jgi:hypothetical protein